MQHLNNNPLFVLKYQQFCEFSSLRNFPHYIFHINSPQFNRTFPWTRTEGSRIRSNPKICVLKPSEVIFNSSCSPPLWTECYRCSEPDLIWESWDWMSCVLISKLKVGLWLASRSFVFRGKTVQHNCKPGPDQPHSITLSLRERQRRSALLSLYYYCMDFIAHISSLASIQT